MEPIVITKLQTVMQFQAREEEWIHSAHDGNGYAIAYQLDGCYHHQCATGSFVMDKDSIMFYGDRDWYAVQAEKSGPCLAIHFCTAEPIPLSLMHIHGEAAIPYKSDFQRIVSTYIRRDPVSWYETMAGLYGLLGKLLHSQEREISYGKRQKYENIALARDYIHEHFGEPDLCVEQTAERAGLSVRRFGELFSQLYGMTPGRYITHIRLQAAEEMLCTHSYSVTEIAHAVGYRDIGYFCRVFTRIYEMSPGQYAKKQ